MYSPPHTNSVKAIPSYFPHLCHALYLYVNHFDVHTDMMLIKRRCQNKKNDTVVIKKNRDIMITFDNWVNDYFSFLFSRLLYIIGYKPTIECFFLIKNVLSDIPS